MISVPYRFFVVLRAAGFLPFADLDFVDFFAARAGFFAATFFFGAAFFFTTFFTDFFRGFFAAVFFAGAFLAVGFLAALALLGLAIGVIAGNIFCTGCAAGLCGVAISFTAGMPMPSGFC